LQFKRILYLTPLGVNLFVENRIRNVFLAPLGATCMFRPVLFYPFSINLNGFFVLNSISISRIRSLLKELNTTILVIATNRSHLKALITTIFIFANFLKKSKLGYPETSSG